MIIKLEEESWELREIEKLQKRFNRNYIFECINEKWIELDNLYSLLDEVTEELEWTEEKLQETTYKLDKDYQERQREATYQEMIWESKRGN